MAWMMMSVAIAWLVLAGLVMAAGRRMVVSPMVSVPDRRRTRPRIVIVGGGFGGIYTARYLERALHALDDFEVVLINRENYFVFQPMLPEVISGSIGVVDTVSPIRRLLPNTELHVREVESIDLDGRVVRLSLLP